MGLIVKIDGNDGSYRLRIFSENERMIAEFVVDRVELHVGHIVIGRTDVGKTKFRRLVDTEGVYVGYIQDSSVDKEKD